MAYKIHIDDVTGNQIAHPNDATNGGSRMLEGEQADKWLKENPDKRLDSKEVRQAPNKSAAKADTK